jgi:hypothetical protein
VIGPVLVRASSSVGLDLSVNEFERRTCKPKTRPTLTSRVMAQRSTSALSRSRNQVDASDARLARARCFCLPLHIHIVA